ncbi:hypothetical protein ACFO5R_03050 [Halosolutus amylolyticus]|uniref:DUF7511 domain-containing protein n=1 Tax=Halosolutus amylolyticus TaxID=2932267 RepID=A0ABD5PKN5_9EURY|nr:hypothetical protein [Halosolutus amylolyticus]
MTDSTPTDFEPEWTGSADPGATDPSRSGLMAVVVGPAERPVCTIYPPDVATPYQTTTWITASGDAFVARGEMR